jgi:deoxyribodipyrimidine photolyase-related protein
MNNIEGFIRQILGWREYMRYIYHHGECNELHISKYYKKDDIALQNIFWSSKNEVINNEYIKVMQYGYSHHIVRLMVFLNMMKLKHIKINDIVKWFSCTHIDAYPWVMYSNILAMGYYNKGFMSKAYVSNSNYILKNSNYKKGKWVNEWNNLYSTYRNS